LLAIDGILFRLLRRRTPRVNRVKPEYGSRIGKTRATNRAEHDARSRTLDVPARLERTCSGERLGLTRTRPRRHGEPSVLRCGLGLSRALRRPRSWSFGGGDDDARSRCAPCLDQATPRGARASGAIFRVELARGGAEARYKQGRHERDATSLGRGARSGELRAQSPSGSLISAKYARDFLLCGAAHRLACLLLNGFLSCTADFIVVYPLCCDKQRAERATQRLEAVLCARVRQVGAAGRGLALPQGTRADAPDVAGGPSAAGAGGALSLRLARGAESGNLEPGGAPARGARERWVSLRRGAQAPRDVVSGWAWQGH
jgi:hypothetical protein